MTWKNAEKEKPNNAEYVLACYSNSFGKYAGMMIVRFVNNGFYSKCSSYSVDNITHWKPLPSKPGITD